MANIKTNQHNKKDRTLKWKIILIPILLFIVIFMTSSLIIKYKIVPNELYLIEKENLVEDGSFENFNETAGDCCNVNQNKSSVFASSSKDAVDGIYSLKLSSEYQCACINKPVLNLDNKQRYYTSFYYKGYNPRVCFFSTGENKCNPEKRFTNSQNWTKYKSILSVTDKSNGLLVYFYADSSGELRTNYYDALEVHKLTALDVRTKVNENDTYIVRTKSDNKVNGELISEDEKTNEAYYIVEGKPVVTIKFPYYEIVIISIITAIIVRLLLMKEKHSEF